MQKTLNAAVEIVGEAFTNTHQIKCVGEVEFVSPPSQPQRACRWFWLRPLDIIHHNLYMFLHAELSRILFFMKLTKQEQP